MNTLKVAILEDSKILLKDLKENLEDTTLVEVVVWATNPNEFFEKIGKCNIDALILDIDISGDSMTGLDIANKLQLPVLFVSGKTKDFFNGIEELNINSEYSIDHISKPITLEKLNKILPKFINQIKAINSSKFIFLDFENTRRNKIEIDSIVYLESDKQFGANSNNKRIYFTDRPSETLIDFSFVKMEEKGLLKNIFITTHRSFRVNTKHILSYNNDNHSISLQVFTSSNKTETKELPVSENYRKIVREINK